MLNIDQFPDCYGKYNNILGINDMIVNRNVLKELIRKANAYDEIIENTKELVKDESATN